ncbi:NAD(P)H-hydrate epimerase (EC / ADP-dependent (S)-NAD(P)H-hydrate dehydratase (EC [Amycolatopsis camponoti]|uniref:Bifunctional NAD(P)H-hydrate repair enzyme n=1 Tax=Amycolatopsis camponoti TaxID=2606593 RepID=A0A6I8M5W7_9PSEU|nr:NAD(P)H-hydrate dehydratase [Amycolatopsis camponoti]VVJ24263.1 NAD(P)H-hydrate epimerase (EC / ADP-dependent (S)-NAD(P)H-hydrate dehydratase (EC [Amycolatopsis camponoti]
MQGIWTTERIREAEGRAFAVTPEGELMRRASFGLSVQLADFLGDHTGAVSGRRVVLLVGSGDNGGDALWAGAFLRRRGVAVTAILLKPEKAHPAGLEALKRAGGRIVSPEDGPQWIAKADVVVDGIIGISGKGGLRPDAARLVELVEAPIVAVDLPSGVDPDTGAVDGPAVKAARTVTFGALKPVHALAPTHCGEVVLVDIGLELADPDLRRLDIVDVAAAWPVPGPEDDKYSQGVVGIAAGSATYPGAAVLAAGSAVRATAGLVRYAGHAADVVRSQWPEIIATGTVADAGRVQAWAVGPGIGTGSEGRDVLRHVLGQGVPVCADADATTIIAKSPEVLDARDPDTPLVLTPHAGEYERLMGRKPGADRVAAAREAAKKYDAVVLLKGHVTVIAAPDGRVAVNTPRGAWLATAGSGDVLSGLVGALLAAGLDPWLAAAAAAHVHSLAGAIAAQNAPTSASGLVHAIPEAIRAIRSLTS